ncbi:nucleoporin NUP188 homolog isoform X2 [Lingula anatina]|uniref:Nucleoporin NUP188 homolog isoform X2 n=1 Tax=Lingula anatina TaxID=7574 RepID=A0A1S3I4S1_LINAN|nr:nucleoporin NUP188 homolog isoform X2 [Lingula anatina]|eukprot:XP_013393265.1 nucleoporin NUP188 homolog isoform X2 [Lingula anatina]
MVLGVAGSSKREVLGLTVEAKSTILSDLLTELQAQLADVTDTHQVKVCSILSATSMTLLHTWAGILKPWTDRVYQLEVALRLSCASSEVLLPSIQLGLLGALTLATQQIKLTAKQDVLSLKSLCPVVCTLLQKVTYQLPPARKANVCSKDVELLLKILTVCVTLLDELIQSIEDPAIWLPSIQEHTVLPVLLSSVQTYIQARQGLQYIQAVLLLFLSLAKYQQSAEALALNGLAQHTCLAVSELYKENNAEKQKTVACRNQGSAVTLSSLYLLSVELYSAMLSTLKYTFLNDALDFLGVHQQQMEWCLSNVGTSLDPDDQKAAEVTCDFLCQLSPYHQQWRMQLPQLLGTMLSSICFVSHSCISLLIRPQLLKYLLEKKHGSEPPQKVLASQSMAQHLPLQHQTSTDEVEQPSEQLVQVQESHLKLVGLSLTFLRHFTPDLCEAMLDQSLDVNDSSPLLDLGFNTPSTEKEGPVNFGTYLACINSCVRMLSRSEMRAASPNRTPFPAVSVSRHILLFVLENTLYFLLSQTMRYLRDPKLHQREKQYLKRELAAELNSFLQGLQRYLRRGAPQSPGGSTMASPQVGKTSSYAAIVMTQEFPFYKLVSDFIKHILR